jgi:hypothetical protein
MSSAEFVSMTLAFADHMARTASSQNHSAYIQAREELTRHLHDSYAGIGLHAFAEGMAHQVAILKGDDE